MKNDTFCRLPVTRAQCVIGTENYPDAGMLLNYDDDDDDSHGYGQIREVFEVLTKDDILHPCMSDQDFRSSNVKADDVGWNLYVFDIRNQQNFTALQPPNQLKYNIYLMESFLMM